MNPEMNRMLRGIVRQLSEVSFAAAAAYGRDSTPFVAEAALISPRDSRFPFPGSLFAVSNVYSSEEASDMVKTIRKAVPAGWKSMWRKDDDLLVIAPKDNKAVVKSGGYAKADYDAWAKTGAHDAIKKAIDNWADKFDVEKWR